MAKLRTANLLGALAVEIASRVERRGKLHPNETNSATTALNVIGFYESCYNGTLNSALRLSHAATVGLVDKLEAADLLVSEPGADQRTMALRRIGLGHERGHRPRERPAAIHDYLQTKSVIFNTRQRLENPFVMR